MERCIRVRPIRESDLPQLANIEDAAWARHGIPALTPAELVAWYEEQSPLFLVAECDGRICGYYFGRLIRFTMADAPTFLAPTAGWEWGRHPHDPRGDSAYGICVASVVPGAGAALNDAVHRVLAERRLRYFVGISRLSGFDRFARTCEGASSCDEHDLALWYAHASATLLSMRTWPCCAPRPQLTLPALRRPDPVLAFHVRGTSFRLAGLLPGYLPDAASRGYGAVIISRYPHRR